MPVGGYVAVDILFDLAYVVDYGARTPGGYVYLQAPAFTGRCFIISVKTQAKKFEMDLSLRRRSIAGLCD